jgi:hypothetical protein
MHASGTVNEAHYPSRVPHWHGPNPPGRCVELGTSRSRGMVCDVDPYDFSRRWISVDLNMDGAVLRLRVVGVYRTRGRYPPPTTGSSSAGAPHVDRIRHVNALQWPNTLV